MADNKKAARSVTTTPNGKNTPRKCGTLIPDNAELVNMSRSELVKTAKATVEELYSKLFPNEKLAVCAVISVMLNRCPTPIQDAETAARVRETLLSFAETEPQNSCLAEYCRQAAAAITSQGGAT